MAVENTWPLIDRLCRTYSYPADMGRLLAEIVSAIQLPSTKSIVLSGSAGRGELVFTTSASGLRLFSDLELFVIADQVDLHQREAAFATLKLIEERQWKIGARTFHTDIDFLTTQQWQNQLDRFQGWETAKAGWILFGDDVLNVVQSSRVEPRAAIQSSLNRLWHLLLYLPERLLRRCPTEDDLQVFNYSLNRAVLDFPLWLLVHRGVLVPGFAGRQKYLHEHRDDFRQPGLPIDDLLEAVDAAVRARHHPELKQDVIALYETVLGWYPRLVSWTLNLSPATDNRNFPATLRAHHRQLYSPLNWKRHAWEMRMMKEVGASSSPVVAMNWLREKKQATITTFLWHMHQAAKQYLTNSEAEADEQLRLAEHDLGLLFPGRSVNSAAFIERWLLLRRIFFDFLMLFYRGLKQKESYYEVVLDYGQSL